MSEAWKSTPRKYCDFCKCWIADNKISVSIHENGKGHKAAVQKKITSSHKASVRKEKEEIQAQKLFRIMEKNAKEAYKRDMGLNSNSKVQTDASCSNASSTNSSISKQKRQSESGIRPNFDAKQPKIEEKEVDDDEPEWYEFKTNSGQLYYIHVKTNESTWVKPESPNILKVYDNVGVSETKEEPEPKSSAFRDISTTHGYRSKEELEYAEMKTEPREGAKGREMAYGAFVPVENPDELTRHPIKLDLPEQTDNSHLFSHLPREAFEEDDPDDRLKVKEKRIEFDEDDFDDEVKKEPASSLGLFKKRKFGSNKNRNFKQRDEVN
ncbi:uncharacterized protein LOC142352313 [Convolutriloba macropyga]|uniref:uncharacterized protein LOC142352313 n=1 Tax=Convolutriloba macropyga TaxID=536237 RepID=UPI003F51E8CB